MGNGYQFFTLLVYIADEECLVQVAMETIVINSNINCRYESIKTREKSTVFSLCCFYRYFNGKCAASVSDLVPPLEGC